MANADYLHLELIFNPLELTFISEVDTNKDGELDPEELRTKGSIVATRMTDALKLSVNGRAVKAESHGMDPDMTGHHVRLRAHYKVDARDQPVTIASELKSITSSSHLVQAAFHNGSRRELAQLDSHSSTVTFNATASKEKPAPPPQKAQGLLSRKPKTKEK